MNDPRDTQPKVPDLSKVEPLFDILRGKSAAQSARQRFDNQLKKAERMLWLSVYVLGAAALWALQRSIGTTSLKAGLFYGLIVLVAFEMVVLIHLWYWIVDTKISLLKDMKQLRLQVGQGGSQAQASADEPAKPLTAMALSKLERTAWAAGQLVVWAVVVFYAMPAWMPELATAERDARAMQSERTVTIRPDGSGTVASRYSIPNDGLFPMDRFQAYNSPRSGQPSFSDFAGHDLTTAVQPIPFTGQAAEKLTVSLPEPVMPGQRLFLKESASVPLCAEKTGDVWKYRDEQLWRTGENVFSYRYSYRIELPAGAKLLSASPRFVSSHHEEGGPEDHWTVVEFHDRKPRAVPFRVEVTYSLP